MKSLKKILSLLLAALLTAGCASVVYAVNPEAQQEKEPNGDKAHADCFHLDGRIDGSISTVDDEDWYYFEVVSPGLATVTLSHDAKEGADKDAAYFSVEICDEEGDLVAAFKSTGGDKNAVSDSFGASPGKFYVKVVSAQVCDSTLHYSLAPRIDLNALVEVENNNAPERATPLALSSKGDEKIYHGVVTPGDVDYYSVSVPAPGVLYFYLYNGSVERGDYKITLYQYIDAGEAKRVSLGSLTVSKLDGKKMSPSVGVNGGRYLIGVEGVDGSVGAYRTRAFFFLNNESEYEFNDDTQRATQIFMSEGTDGVVCGGIFGSTFDNRDVDYFKFKVPEKNYGYEIKLSAFGDEAAGKAGKWITSIERDKKVIVQNVEATGTKPAEISTDALSKGIYYVKITSGNNDGANDGVYRLELKAKPKPSQDDEGSLWEKIKQLDWKGFWENFSDWITKIGYVQIVRDIVKSFIDVIKHLGSLQK